MRGGASGGCGRRRRTNHVERERLETRWGCQPMNSSNQSRCAGLFLPVLHRMAACPEPLEQRLLGGRECQTLLFEVVDD